MRSWWSWLVGAVGLFLVAAVMGSFFIDEPLRQHVERQMNTRLQGYTMHLGALDVHPFSFSVELKEVVIGQVVHPDPPIIHVPELNASVQWRALLLGQVVADVKVERPALRLNRTQLRHEARDEVPVQERGRQAAVQAALPLQINALRVFNGEATYIDADPARSLRARQQRPPRQSGRGRLSV
jgi:uncharacterized protein involved in outer membrane biogenesis